MAELKYSLLLQAEEARRARQREHVKNSYYRKQNAMKALRHEVRQLEHEYARTIQLKQQQQWREVTEALGSDAEREGSDALVEKYMQLSIKKQQLHRENQALGAVLAQHAKFHLKAQHVLDAEDSQTLAVVPPPSTSSLDGVAFEPMTVVECHEIAIAAYQEICAFQESKSHVTTGHELFGWREQRREASDRVEFTLKKRFVGCTPSDMSVRGWRVVSSPRGLAGLYSSSMSLTLKVVQVVDDHNVVMHRVIRSAHTRRTVQTLFLVTRFRAKSGYIILFRSVDRSRLRKLSQHSDTAEGDGVEDKWLDIFTWTLFEAEPGNDNVVQFSYGGTVYSTEAVGTHVWMLEILMLAIHWENKVVGPTLMLRDSQVAGT